MQKIARNVVFDDTISGVVQRGQQLARTFGFPTANILCLLDIPEGVYGALTEFSLNSVRCYQSMAYLKDGLLEVHLIGEDMDLYDRLLYVKLIRFIRPPIPYISSGVMKAQIQNDLENVKASFTVFESYINP